LGTLTAHGYSVLKSADKLLYVVKLYKEKVGASIEELKNIKAGELAPDWFKGTSKGSIGWITEEASLTNLFDFEADFELDVEFSADMDEEIDLFEGEADDLFFEMFIDSINEEVQKIDKDATETLERLSEKVENWGNPMAD